MLGVAQTLAWGSSYYLPAILAAPMAAGTGLSPAWVFAAFSASLLIAAFVGPAVGRAIDRHGGRGTLALSSVPILAVGLFALAAAGGPVSLFAAWAILGVGMALGLYDAAFAALASFYGTQARGPITGITLMAGFASTVKLAADLAAQRRGRLARDVPDLGPAQSRARPAPQCLAAARDAAASRRRHRNAARVGWHPRREMLLLAFVFAAAWFVTGSMAAHLPELLERAGATHFAAIAAAALVGPAQVAARLVEFVALRRIHPLVSARVAASLQPLGAVVLAVVGAAGAAPFAILYGAGNGILTIARGTVPLALFGPNAYGERTGLLGAPARAAQALAPLLFGLLLGVMGLAAIFISAGLCVAALIALLCLRKSTTAPTEPPAGKTA